MEKYFLIATISSIAFYAIYYFFLRKEAFHRFNRLYLLSVLMVSLVIPLLRFSVSVPHSIPEAGVAPAFSNLTELITYIRLPEFTVFTNPGTATSFWNISNLCFRIYWTGVFIFSALFIIKLIKISLLIIQSEKNRNGKYNFVKYDENMAPFSFFNYIFINAAAYNKEDSERMILHEQIHVRQRHSWDLIFTELIGIVLWFNPIILFYKRSLQIIHEYSADRRVLQQGIEQGAYLNLLLRQLTLQNEWMMGHHFNYLLTKNRFKMLKKKNYSRWALAKVAFALPFIAVLLLLNCKPKPEEPEISDTVEYNFTLENVEEGEYEMEITKNEDKSEDITIKKTKKIEGKPDANGIYRFPGELPEPVGGFDQMYNFIRENITYPQDARDKGISGQVFLEFVVGKDGSIGNVKVLKGVDPDLDAEALRVIKMLPAWNPGKQNGVPVRCYYNIPIRFTIN